MAEPREHQHAVDDRIHRAFDELVEPPAADLFDRLVTAIAQDEARRGRRRRLAVAVATVAVIVGLAVLQRGAAGAWVLDWRWLEVLETVVMLALVLGLRPLLDGAGRDFLEAAAGGSPRGATAIAPLLDFAWNLVFVGLTIMTVEWRPIMVGASLATQLDHSLERVGLLLLVMGILHGVTFLALPLVGVVWRAARTGRPLPRWVLVLLLVLGGPVVFVLVAVLAGLLLRGASG